MADRLGDIGDSRRDEELKRNEHNEKKKYPPDIEGENIDTYAEPRKSENQKFNEYKNERTYPDNIEGDEIDTYTYRKEENQKFNEYNEAQSYPDNIEGDEIDTYTYRKEENQKFNEYNENDTYPENNEGEEIDTFTYRKEENQKLNEYNEGDTYPDNNIGDEIDTYTFRKDENQKLNEYNPNDSYPDNNTGDEIDTFTFRKEENQKLNEYSQNDSYPDNNIGDEIDTFSDSRKEENQKVNEFNPDTPYNSPDPELTDISLERREFTLKSNDFNLNEPYDRNSSAAISDGDENGKGLNPLTFTVGSSKDIEKLNQSLTKNLYSPNNVYDLQSPALLESISNITNLLAITTDIDLPDRIVNAVENLFPQTPITEIALARLGDSIAKKVNSNVKSDVLPRLNVSNAIDDLFGEDGSNNDSIITFPADFEITKPSGLLRNVGFYLQEIAGTNIRRDEFSDVEKKNTPFGVIDSRDKSEQFILSNTGKEQIRRLVKGIRQNAYVPYVDERRFARFLEKYDKGYRNVLLDSGELDREESQTGYIKRKTPLKDVYIENPQTDEEFIQNSVNSVSETKRQKHLNDEGFGSDNVTSIRFDQDLSSEGNVVRNKTKGVLKEGEGGQITEDDLAESDKGVYIVGKEAQNEEFGIQRGLLYYVNKVIDTNHPIKKNISQIPEDRNACGYGSKSFAGPDNDKQYSRGINNIHCSEEDRVNKVYCRSWTRVDQYNTFNKAVRDGVKYRNAVYDEGTFDGSVLHRSGRARVHPLDPSSLTDQESRDRNFKRLMLSMENLAYVGENNFIAECEKGPFGGRLMWFPPYNLNVSETNSIEWNGKSYIARPEKVYTYNNSTRSINLTFTLLSDYPSIINKVDRNNIKEWELRSYIHGCTDLPLVPPAPAPTPGEITDIETQIEEKTRELERLEELDGGTIEQDITTDEDNTVPTGSTSGFNPPVFYFENDVEEFDSSRNKMPDGNGGTVLYESTTGVYDLSYFQSNPFTYEIWDGGRGGTVAITGQEFDAEVRYNVFGGAPREIKQSPSTSFQQRTYFGLNSDFQSKFDELIKKINENELLAIKVIGRASELAPASYNYKLSEARAQSIKRYIEKHLTRPTKIEIKVTGLGEPTPESEADDAIEGTWEVIDRQRTKTDRRVDVEVVTDQEKVTEENNRRKQGQRRQRQEDFERQQRINREKETLKNEIQVLKNRKAEIENSRKARTKCYYFEDIPSGDQPFFYDELRKQIDYFHPSFHSQTPEDLNSRMTFLRQCTLPGRPISGSTSAKNNLFGRPPVVVLRVGDFYYTRAIVTSLNFQTNDTIIWDQNPEGIGIQPMMMAVTMDLTLLGGSSLDGPINQLQNALSFNSYANTEVYEPAALKYEDQFVSNS